jgi:hypothetical protein
MPITPSFNLNIRLYLSSYFLFLLISRTVEKINNNAGNTPRNNTFSLNNPAPVSRIRVSSEGGRELSTGNSP